MTNVKPQPLTYFHDKQGPQRRRVRAIAMVILVASACAAVGDLAITVTSLFSRESNFRLYVYDNPGYAWNYLIAAVLQLVLHTLMMTGAIAILRGRGRIQRRIATCLCLSIATSVSTLFFAFVPQDPSTSHLAMTVSYEAASSIAWIVFDIALLLIICHPWVRDVLETLVVGEHEASVQSSP